MSTPRPDFDAAVRRAAETITTLSEDEYPLLPNVEAVIDAELRPLLVPEQEPIWWFWEVWSSALNRWCTIEAPVLGEHLAREQMEYFRTDAKKRGPFPLYRHPAPEQAAASGWVPVRERLPEHLGQGLVWIVLSGRVRLAFVSYAGKWRDGTGLLFPSRLAATITHWQEIVHPDLPLPDPPATETPNA